MKRNLGRIVLSSLVLLGLSACGEDTEQSAAMIAAQRNAQEASIYIPENAIELANYNQRQRIADDPTSILWCSFFPFGDTGPVTFAVVGKLTSGNKRPYPTSRNVTGYSADYSPERPGPDGMYGSSGEYRYGFSPDGNYHDLYGVQSYCTTMPMVYRRQPSGLTVSIVEPQLARATEQAREALRAGLNNGEVSQEALANADRILNEALTQ